MNMVKSITSLFVLFVVAGLLTSCASQPVVQSIPLKGVVGGLVIKEFEGNGGHEMTNALLSAFRTQAKENFLIWDERQYEEVIKQGGDPTIKKPNAFENGPDAFVSGNVIFYSYSESEDQYFKQIEQVVGDLGRLDPTNNNSDLGELSQKLYTANKFIGGVKKLLWSKGIATVVVDFSVTQIKTGKNITAKTLDGRKGNSLIRPDPPNLLLLQAINIVANDFVNSITLEPINPVKGDTASKDLHNP